MERLTKRESTNVGGMEFVLCNCKKEDCNDSCMYESGCKWNKKALRKLKEYEDLEENRFLLRLPVPIGSTVYDIEYEYGFEVGDTTIRVIPIKFEVRLLEHIGKTVFLTPEEAEQALVKMKEV